MKQTYNNFDHEYLLFRNTLRKLGVWNEYLMEKGRLSANKGPIKEKALRNVLQDYHTKNNDGIGTLLMGFPSLNVSFSWIYARDKSLWPTVWGKISTDPLFTYLYRMNEKKGRNPYSIDTYSSYDYWTTADDRGY